MDYYFTTIAEAKAYAEKMSRKYRCTFYIVKWSDASLEVVGPLDMYAGMHNDKRTTKIKAQEG